MEEEKKKMNKRCLRILDWEMMNKRQRHDHSLVLPVLPEDVLILLLSKLPVKTLMKFRCVCKRWRYLISDDASFVKIYSGQARSRQPLYLFSFTTANPWKKGPHCISFNSIDNKRNPITSFRFKKFQNVYSQIVPTRLELVCIQDSDIVHICNPSRHEIITLPNDPDLPSSASCTSVGFGFVESTDEFKVVRFIPPDGLYGYDGFSAEPACFKTKCQVFTLGGKGTSWAWRNVEGPPHHVGYCKSPAVVNGAIHWLVLYDSMVDTVIYNGGMIDPNNTILAFDMKSEKFRLISHPEGCPDVRSSDSPVNLDFQLAELRGFLCLSCIQGSKMDIWKLKEYESGTWVKEHSIDLNVLDSSYQLRKFIDVGRYYVPRDIDDTKILMETYSRGVGYYHLQTTSFKGFQHSKPKMPKLRFTFYVETLRSLKTLAPVAPRKCWSS